MAEEIEIYDQVEPIYAAWDELATRLRAAPFLHPGWMSAWWEAFGPEKGFSVIALRREGSLVAVMPIWRRGRVIASPTNWHTPAYGPVAEDEASKVSLMRTVFELAPRRIDLSFLNGSGGDVKWIGQAAQGYQITSRVVMRSPYVPVDDSWDAYWGTLPQKLRSNIRRRRRLLDKRGAVAVEISDGSSGMESLLAEGFRIEAAGWKGERGTAIASEPQTRRFYEQVCHWAAQRGLLRLIFLRVDGKAVVFNLCLETPDRHYVLKLGHDPDFDRESPATLLACDMIARTFAKGMKSYEWLGDALPYKLRWSKTSHEMVRVQAFAPSASGAVDRFVQLHGRRLAKSILRRDSAS